MNVKSSAHYQREYRKRLREQGLVKKEIWILPEHAGRLADLEKQLRVRGEATIQKGEMNMSEATHHWSTASLHEALLTHHLVRSGQAKIEVVDGVEPALQIIMNEYGDLPVFLTVSGEQIIAESILWPASDVNDIAAFNDTVLRTHKYFPLSTISLDHMGDAGDVYQMFGALSARSLLENIVLEIEVLASNVIQATEAYSEFLKPSVSVQSL